MYRITTPTHTFTLPEPTSNYSVIQVTYRQRNFSLVKEYKNNVLPDGMTLDGKNVIIKLTQEETKDFKSTEKASVQVRVLTPAGDAYASQEFLIDVDNVLNGEILENDS